MEKYFYFYMIFYGLSRKTGLFHRFREMEGGLTMGGAGMRPYNGVGINFTLEKRRIRNQRGFSQWFLGKPRTTISSAGNFSVFLNGKGGSEGRSEWGSSSAKGNSIHPDQAMEHVFSLR